MDTGIVIWLVLFGLWVLLRLRRIPGYLRLRRDPCAYRWDAERRAWIRREGS